MSSSSSSSSSQSSLSSSSSSNYEFTPYGYQVVEVNGSATKNQFLPLYNASNPGTASDRDFWGCIYTPGELTNLSQAGFLSMTINASTYWMEIWTADAVACDCATNLTGTWRAV